MPTRERVFKEDEYMILESASFSSLLRQFQLQISWIKKRSRRQNGSRRMASSDVLFIHSRKPGHIWEIVHLIMIVLTKSWMTGFWMRNWWIAWQAWSFLRIILENSCLRLGRRNEEETRAHFLSKRLSLPTAAIILSMMSCGISTDSDFAYYILSTMQRAFKLVQLRWD